MAFTYFLILWSTAWSPSRLCEREEKNHTPGAREPCQARPPLPPPSQPAGWRLLCHAALRGSGRAPGAGPGAGGIPGTLEPQRPAGPLPGPRSPTALLPGRALGRPGSSERVAGGERLGQRAQRRFGSRAASSNHGKCRPGSRRGWFNQAGDEASRSTNTPARPRHPSTRPRGSGSGTVGDTRQGAQLRAGGRGRAKTRTHLSPTPDRDPNPINPASGNVAFHTHMSCRGLAVAPSTVELPAAASCARSEHSPAPAPAPNPHPSLPTRAAPLCPHRA